ncbi:MAG: four-helix bundle copper-binding protein [Magnetospirillum sp.]|nr:four-helix bundle copper-binding protein [Magnetospirillum sp.]
MHARQMLTTHPHVRGSANDALITCIEECFDCAQTCVTCADACLGEPDVADLVQCIRLNQDCSDVCAAAGAVATRRSGSNEGVIRAMLEACQTACSLCAEECERHAGSHDHCRICAAECRACEEACRKALQSLRN